MRSKKECKANFEMLLDKILHFNYAEEAVAQKTSPSSMLSEDVTAMRTLQWAMSPRKRKDKPTDDGKNKKLTEME